MLLFTTQGITQILTEPYTDPNGVTFYPNGTEYRPSHTGNGNQSGSDIVKTRKVTTNSDGDKEITETTIFCKRNPEGCKEALEEAADDAERRGNDTQSIKDGCGTLDDWLSRPSDWPMSPPIFFPDGRTPGIPIAPQRIASHTDRIIRQIR